MTRWIRWKGLAAFLAVVTLIGLVWVLLVDTAVRRTIEVVGTRAVGARVELAQADLTLFPTGLELRGLAVTNPDEPMRNAVEIGRIRMDLDPGQLIRRKIIVNEVALEGLRLNTPRQRSGEVPKLAQKRAQREAAGLADQSLAALERVCGPISMPSLEQPDVSAILAKEPLMALQQAADLDQRLKAERGRWEAELARLADEKTLAEYRARVERLKGTGRSLGAILGSAGEVRQLQADIQKDLDLLKQAQAAFSTDLKNYQQQVKALAQAPLTDINRLLEKYSLSPAGLANLSQLIFGERLCGWIETAWDWYGRIEPHLARLPKGADPSPQPTKPLRGRGENIRFAESPPMPDFLIRHLKLNAGLAAGNFTGKMENITLDPHILGAPLTFAFLGKEMQLLRELSLIGSADFVKPDDPAGSARLTVNALALENLPLVRGGALPLVLQQASSDLTLNLQAAKTGFDGALKSNFSAVRFLVEAGETPTAITRAIAAAVTGVERFSLDAAVSGTPADFTMTVRSDLDQVLRSAVGNLVQAETARFKAALTEQVTARLQGPLAQARGGLDGLGAVGAELTQRLNLGEDILKGLKLPL